MWLVICDTTNEKRSKLLGDPGNRNEFLNFQIILKVMEFCSSFELQERKTNVMNDAIVNVDTNEVRQVEKAQAQKEKDTWSRYLNFLKFDLFLQIGFFLFIALLALKESSSGAFMFATATYLLFNGPWTFLGNTLRILLYWKDDARFLSWRFTYEWLAIIYLILIFADAYFAVLGLEDGIFVFAPLFALLYTAFSILEAFRLSEKTYS